MAAARLGYLVGPSWLVAELDKVVLPYHLDAAKQIAGRLALRFVDEMEERVASIVAERSGSPRASTSCRSTVFPSGANFILFRPRDDAGPAVWEELLDRSVLVRDCSSWPRLDDCLRVTVGTPRRERRVPRRAGGGRSNERARRRGRRATKETQIELSIDLDGIGQDRRLAPASRSTTTCSISSASTAASTSASPATATCTSTPTTRSRTSPSRSARRSARRSATRSACAASPAGCSRSTRRSSRSPSTCPAGRSSCGTSSCPSACRSATRRSTRSSPSTPSRRSPRPPASPCT